jgi:hypothetical protein
MKAIKYLALISLVLFLGNPIKAQNLIAVQNVGTTMFYTKLDTAIVHAVNGDTIYLPGGNFALNVNISKRLHIIGAGYRPDSSFVTNPTNINVSSALYLITGADGGSLIGIKLNGILYFGTSPSNANVSNYTVGRCYIVGSVTSYSNTATNNLFYENILSGGGIGNQYSSINMANAESNYFYNNIISGGYGGMGANTVVGIGAGSVFKNNILINNNTYYCLQAISNTVFENNIFACNSFYYSPNIFENNLFNNNLFVLNISFPFGTTTGSNNIVNQAINSIFVNRTGNNFSYTDDYHLQLTCPGKNFGKDGTDIGIYGGAYPWKDGGMPFNPHFQKAIIGPTTDGSGNLDIQIKVAAQDR